MGGTSSWLSRELQGAETLACSLQRSFWALCEMLECPCIEGGQACSLQPSPQACARRAEILHP